MPKTKEIVWNLKSLFKNDDDPEILKKREILISKSDEFINKWKEREDYLTDAKILKQALQEYEVQCRFYAGGGDEYYYFNLRNEQEENNPTLKAKFNQIDELARKIQNQIQFFYLNIAKKILLENQQKFLKDKDLVPYRHFLEKAFAAGEHLLSDAEEKIINLKTKTSQDNWVKMISGFLSREQREVLVSPNNKELKTFSEILNLNDSSDKKIRDSAAVAFNDILLKYVDVAEHELNSILSDKKTDDQLRNFLRPDSSRHIDDDISTEAVDSLTEVVSKSFEISRKFYALKAKLLGQKKINYFERNVIYKKVDTNFSFENATKLIDQVFKKINPQFNQIFKNFLANGQIDVYSRLHKTDGAFCAHYLISQSTYILLNYTGRLRDVLTLAHELGHGINNELVREKQNALNFGTPTSTAEVASTFMEDFVLQELLKEADDETRLSLMIQKLNDDVSTIFRQIACYQFEKELHQIFRQKGYLSKEEIGQLFIKNMKSYLGESVDFPSGSENWWVYWSHIRNFFYVYSYASGLLISKALQASVKENPKFIEKVKEFLSAGLFESPKDIFQKLGINISDKKFWGRGLGEVEKLLIETEKLAKKLNRV